MPTILIVIALIFAALIVAALGRALYEYILAPDAEARRQMERDAIHKDIYALYN